MNIQLVPQIPYRGSAPVTAPVVPVRHSQGQTAYRGGGRDKGEESRGEGEEAGEGHTSKAGYCASTLY